MKYIFLLFCLFSLADPAPPFELVGNSIDYSFTTVKKNRSMQKVIFISSIILAIICYLKSFSFLLCSGIVFAGLMLAMGYNNYRNFFASITALIFVIFITPLLMIYGMVSEILS